MKDVQGYEGNYCVDELGNVYSVKRGKARRLRPFLNSRGYPTVSLCVNGKESYKTVHRLVATAFIPNRDNLPQVNHITFLEDGGASVAKLAKGAGNGGD